MGFCIDVKLLTKSVARINSCKIKTMQNLDNAEGLIWTTEAKVKFKNIPYFVRSQARQRIEQIALAEGSDTITAEIVEKARVEFGQ